MNKGLGKIGSILRAQHFSRIRSTRSRVISSRGIVAYRILLLTVSTHFIGIKNLNADEIEVPAAPTPLELELNQSDPQVELNQINQCIAQLSSVLNTVRSVDALAVELYRQNAVRIRDALIQFQNVGHLEVVRAYIYFIKHLQTGRKTFLSLETDQNKSEILAVNNFANRVSEKKGLENPNLAIVSMYLSDIIQIIDLFDKTYRTSKQSDISNWNAKIQGFRDSAAKIILDHEGEGDTISVQEKALALCNEIIGSVESNRESITPLYSDSAVFNHFHALITTVRELKHEIQPDSK